MLITPALPVVSAAVVSAPAGATTSSRVTVARGVTFWRQRYRSPNGHVSRTVLLRVDLSVSRLFIAPVSGREKIAGPRRVVSYLANSNHALAGINADFFHSDGTVHGGMIRSGRIMKSPEHRREANFFVRANGTAGIGAVPFGGSVRRPATGSRAATAAHLSSVNDLRDAEDGHITLATSRLAWIRMDAACTAVTGRDTSHAGEVTGVHTGIRQLRPRRPGRWALISCGGSLADWLAHRLRTGDHVKITKRFADGQLDALASGGAMLVKQGAAHTDPTRVPVAGRNPETFACVGRLGKVVLFGVVDGRSDVSAGVTFRGLTRFMLQLHCYDGMVFDGGGSTEMVARRPGRHRVSLLNVPSDGSQRRVPNGLFVFRR